jgi:hypothetical protein
VKGPILAGAALLLLGGVAWLCALEPSNERDWAPDHAVLPHARFDQSRARLTGVRNFRYGPEGRVTPAFEERTFDLDRLESVWFVLVPFSRRWRAPAHSFVSFGFGDSQFVGISVEARREADEEYGVLPGLARRYELMYVIADERDLVLRRVLHDSNDVYLYPVRATPAAAREMFVAMLDRSNSLAAKPEFYNTLSNNCTSNLIAHVNAIVPGKIPTGWRTLLPGYADEVALELGLISDSGRVEDVRARYLVNARALQHAADPAFSLRIRQADGGTSR